VVPWSDDAGRVSYVDLRREPERIGEVLEAREHPALGRTLLRLNAPESQWATAKCDRWVLDEEDLETASLDLDRDVPFEAGVGSYIDFYYRDAGLFGSLEHYRALLVRLVQAANAAGERNEPEALLELTLRRCVADGREGFAVTALGREPADAEAKWAAALAALTQILLADDVAGVG